MIYAKFVDCPGGVYLNILNSKMELLHSTKPFADKLAAIEWLKKFYPRQKVRFVK